MDNRKSQNLLGLYCIHAWVSMADSHGWRRTHTQG